MTATQLAGLVLGQVVPLGAIGVALGVPIGLAMTWLTVRAVPEYFGGFAISWKGVSWAIVAGAITTLIAAVLPALAALTVSPLEASRPRARKPRAVFYLVAFALAAAAIGGAVWIITQRVRRDYHFVDWSTSAVVLLYIGYALAAPLIIWLFGTLAVRIVSRIVAVRTRILQDGRRACAAP
jgi:predicted lysophospholipase L1 biosynthesis ABC-type transport system permease subunit